MIDELRASLREALGVDVRGLSPVSGGDIHSAFLADLADGDRVFVKASANAPRDMFDAEAHGLSWLAASNMLRVPSVRAVGATWLALEWIERGAPAAHHDEHLGRGLAALHRATPVDFGLDRDNYLATLPQRQATSRTWAGFYGEHRLAPLLARARDRGDLSAPVARSVDNVIAKLPALVGDDEPPARLHGDLWGGNSMPDERGLPTIFDPAVYGGHREVDLAMMRLFGGFSERVFDAYDEAFSLAPGARDRVALYQLYPLLAHVCLFGASYASAVHRAARAYE